MSSIYYGQFYGNILVVGRTGCGKTTFLKKLGLNNFFGNIIKTRHFKTAITWKLPFPPAYSQWAIFEKSTKIIQLHGLVTHVLHTHFT